MTNRTLLLVDAMAVVYRAYYAISGLSTRSGKPTNALFGFIKMVHQLEELWKPTHWSVVFDAGIPAERLEKLPSYKAQREPMPDPLREQIPAIEEFIERSQIAAIRVAGYEADDAVASLVRWAEPQDARVLIASSDKDLFQLITDRVSMVSPTKIGTLTGPAEVVEKTGVRPDQIVDWLALTGDAVDNIPGVPGIGPKTAAKLLAEFGSVDKLLAGADQIESARLREAIGAHREAIRRNVSLVSLRKDLPLAGDWDALKRVPPDPSRLLSFYREMEFGSLAEKVKGRQSVNLSFDFGEPG